MWAAHLVDKVEEYVLILVCIMFRHYRVLGIYLILICLQAAEVFSPKLSMNGWEIDAE